MKKGWIWLLAAVCAALLSACAAPAEEDAGLKLWFGPDPDREKLPPAYSGWSYQGEETVSAMMDALLSGPPEESGLTRIIPAGTQMLDWSMEGRVARVELSDLYAGLTGVDLTLADYSIVLTLTQLDGVDGVRICVDGGGQTFQDRRALYAGDAIFSGAEEEPVEVSAALYFLRNSTGELTAERRMLRLTEDEIPAQAVLELLIAGPEGEGLSALLPEGLRVNSARVDNGVCTADLSAELLDAVPSDPVRQELVISSIVETLRSLDQVEQVLLLVEGEPLERYGGIELSAPLSLAQSPL